MREENFGPVFNPDGSPTAFTIGMLAGTGREPDDLRQDSEEESNNPTNAHRVLWFGQAISQLVDYMSDPNMEYYEDTPISKINIFRDSDGDWVVQAFQDTAFPYVMYINDDNGEMVMDG